MVNEVDLKNKWLELRYEFACQLKSHRLAARLTMPQLVEAVDRGLSVNAYKKYEWRGGEQLPGEDRIEPIIAVLGPDAEGLDKLYRSAADARIQWQEAQRFPERVEFIAQRRDEPWEGYSYRDLFRRSVDAIIYTCFQEETDRGKIMGWRHFLEDDDLPITPVSSSYGLRVLLMANHTGAYPSVGQIRESILRLELPDEGGWAARTQAERARVECYGPVLQTLRLAGLIDGEFEKRVDHLERILDPDFDQVPWSHTAVLTSACNTLSNVRQESRRIPELLDTLQTAVIIDDEKGHAYWTESLDPRRANRLSASPVHTARAICAVAQAPASTVGELRPLAEMALGWLAECAEYRNSTELIERSQPDGQGDYLAERHFAAAWVGRALAWGSSWTEVSPAALWRAEDQILRAVEPDGLWRWESGQQPIWMTYQGLRALREIAIAAHDLSR